MTSKTSKDYRASVGPPEKYDLIGALQFNVLIGLGLREGHKLLDVGCGSLRGGRFFIVYLAKGHYYGLEPEKGLVEDGIRNELGESILKIKRPNFLHDSNFKLSHFGVRFDYILAQSIFSHADMRQIDTCLSEVKKVLLPNGKLVFTYFEGGTNYTGTGWAQAPDARYTTEWMLKATDKHGLTYEKLRIVHPSGQTWVLSEHV